MHNGKEPTLRWCTGTVENTIRCLLDSAIAVFRKILILLICFSLELGDDQGTKNVFDACTSFGFGAITDELIHSSPFADVILKSINKLFIRL